ncbi:unnamed protein product, partial [Prorocentrum cordatum]
ERPGAPRRRPGAGRGAGVEAGRRAARGAPRLAGAPPGRRCCRLHAAVQQGPRTRS